MLRLSLIHIFLFFFSLIFMIGACSCSIVAGGLQFVGDFQLCVLEIPQNGKFPLTGEIIRHIHCTQTSAALNIWSLHTET